MLVLTRKPGERIIIGDDIVVTLISIRRDDDYGDKIRIGLDAPQDVPIRREEVPDIRKLNEPPLTDADLDAAEAESRRLGQKVEALAFQTARECQQPGFDARRAAELSGVLACLRRRCDELIAQLEKAMSRIDKGQLDVQDSGEGTT
jgi:carbon storage regulator CsrA